MNRYQRFLNLSSPSSNTISLAETSPSTNSPMLYTRSPGRSLAVLTPAKQRISCAVRQKRLLQSSTDSLVSGESLVGGSSLFEQEVEVWSLKKTTRKFVCDDALESVAVT